jgi:hypothetical protein
MEEGLRESLLVAWSAPQPMANTASATNNLIERDRDIGNPFLLPLLLAWAQRSYRRRAGECLANF